MKKIIEKYRSDNNISALSVCIHENGIEKLSYQCSDASHNCKKNTRFTIGSISKLFVTVAIMQLVESGLVSLDQSVSDYLCDFVMDDIRYKNITVRMLLNHSSGLGSTTYKKKYTNNFDGSYIQDMLTMYKTLPLKSDPGKYSVYCNDGFVLAQYIVETVANKSFKDYCKEHITIPLGMIDTDFPDTVMAEGTYACSPNEYEHDFKQEFVNGIGSGGVYSTAKDLCLFYDSFYNYKILTKQSVDEMTLFQAKTHINSIDQNSLGYGLGFDHVELPVFKAADLTAVAKGGATFGYFSYGYLIKEKKISICAICSSKSVGVTPLAKELGLKYLNLNELKHHISTLPKTNDIEGIYGSSSYTLKVEKAADSLVLSKYDNCDYTPIDSLTKSDGLYLSSSKILGLNSPKIGFFKENNITYMYSISHDDNENTVELCNIIGQKFDDYSNNRLELLEGKYLKINEEFNQRTFYTQDLQTIDIKYENGYLINPFPLKIISNKAVPFIELPGSLSRDMCQLEVIDSSAFKLGQYLYQHVSLCEQLPSVIVLDSNDTKWYQASLGKNVFHFDKVRVVGITNNKVVYDSFYCDNITSFQIEYLGFLGEIGEIIEVK